eukprot:jgi/Galph1/653/GphlegSOOS_G5330.1
MANHHEDEKRQRARGLIRDREAIEDEINSITSLLTRPGGPGLHGNLIDAEGFPRSDIDIFVVRSQRQRLAQLYNDHKKITDELEQLLFSVRRGSRFTPSMRVKDSLGKILGRDRAPATSFSNNNNAHRRSQGDESNTFTIPLASLGRPFAVVDSVVASSPADVAGFKNGDSILAFGNLSTETSGSELDAFRSLAGTVRDYAYVSIPVAAQRVDMEGLRNVVYLNITPMPWDGPGLLGCRILQFSSNRNEPH